MKASVFMARYLRSQGLQRAFGLPGGETIPLMEALRQVDIPFILTHHEAQAGYMAATTGLLTGVPGLCMATRGPGAANMLSGVALAFLDRLPLIAISGEMEPSQVGRYTHTALDLVGMYRPITKASSILKASEIETALPKAVELARSGRPGPVFFALPTSEANRDVPHLGDMAVDEIGRRYGGSRLTDPIPDLTAVVEALRHSRAPLLMVGIGVVYSRTAPGLLGLAEHLRAPVVVMPHAKGHFPEDHPLFAGAYGVCSDPPILELVRSADLVLAVGLDGVELFNLWKERTPVVSVAPAGAQDPTYAPQIAVDGDLGSILDALRHETDPKPDWTLDRIAQCRQSIEESMDPQLPEVGGRVAPQVAVDELRTIFPRDGILAVDVGAHKQVVLARWKSCEPDTFLNTNGMSSMGSSIGIAIAAKLARPDRAVATVTGDGGFLMFTGELETMARLKLPITVVVMNDGSLSTIKVKQAKVGCPSVGVEFSSPDYAALARSFGLLGFRAGSREECRQSFNQALESGQGAVVQVDVDYGEYPRLDTR